MKGYFASYFASILVTGIQHTWLIFLMLPLLYSAKKNPEIEKETDAEESDDQD